MSDRCECGQRGYNEGYDAGYSDAEGETGWPFCAAECDDLKESRVCGSCDHWYPEREACYYFPVAKRNQSCSDWSRIELDPLNGTNGIRNGVLLEWTK